MKYSINDKWQLVVVRTVEKVEVFDLHSKRKELRTSIDSKREVMESLKEEIERDVEILKWIKENTKEEEQEEEVLSK